MREVFVITHPEATHHIEGRVGGWFDSDLTDRGRRHAHNIAAALSSRVPRGARIYSSDLRRTRQTAAPIAVTLGSDVRMLTELREKSYGAGEGQTQEWFRQRFVPPPAEGERMDHDEGLADAETKASWVRRIYAGMDTVMVDPAPTKVVVTHGGSATFVIAHWLGVPLTALDVISFRLDPGSITHLREDDCFHNHSVMTLNETHHLLD